MTITTISDPGNEIKQNQSLGNGFMQRVVNAIKTASKESGVDFSYLMNKAAQESGFRTDVKASNSSATGLYQFTEQTWLQMVRDNGDKHGIGMLAAKIETRADGSLTVKDRGLRQQILDLRKNPEMSAAMAAEYANDNKTYLQNELGGEIGNTELYMAHFLGAGGAAQFLRAARNNPGTPAASLLPEAAAANRSVFYDANGQPRTVAAIYDRFAAKMDGKGIEIPDDVQARPTMLAEVSNILNGIEDLKLPASNLTLASNTPPLGPSLTGGATAASLFSVMVLSQLDKVGLQSAEASRDGNRQDNRPLQWQTQFA